VVRATGVTGEIVVDISGAPAGRASLSASQVVLNAANDWTAEIGVISQGDRDVGTDISYTLQVATADLGTHSVAITSKENDVGFRSGSAKAVGTYTKGLVWQNTTGSAFGKDDGVVGTIWEGILASGGAGLEARWEFSKLTAGNKQLQLDVWSDKETFRFEYSVDNALTWRGFADGPGNSTAWKGDFIATGVTSNLWVRLVDAVRDGDTVRDAIRIDLMTLGTPPDLLF
jgi:hypothetical protein